MFGSTRVRERAALLVVLVAVTALAVELIRFSGPQFDFIMGNAGVVSAALSALGTYLAPALFTAALCVRRLPSGPMALIAVVALVLARIAVQVLAGAARLGVGLAACALAVAATTIVAAVASRLGGRLVAGGVIGGLFTSAALNLLLGTLDASWRGSLWAFVPTAVLCVAAAVAAWFMRDVETAAHGRGLWAIGPVLCLGVAVFANPAFIASQTSFALWTSGLIIAVCATFTTFVLARADQPVWLHACVLVGAVVLVFFVPSWPEPNSVLVSFAIALGIMLMALSCCGLLVTATQRLVQPALGNPAASESALPESVSPEHTASEHTAPWLGLVGVAAAVGALIIVPILLYQVDYDIPLGFPNELLFVALAVGFAAAVLVAHRRNSVTPTMVVASAAATSHRSSKVMALVSGGLSLVIIGTLALASFVVSPLSRITHLYSTSDTVRLVDWNLHYGVSLDGEVSLEQMVADIKRVDPDVLTLQELSRGWVMAGATDMVTYLANALDMRFAFVGAADNQFGNAILWKGSVPMSSVERTELDFGQGPQHRSAISSTFSVSGQWLTVVSTHLQHRAENTPTRLSQIADMFAGLPLRSHTVIAGDFNAEPGSPEVVELTRRGFGSAFDALISDDSATSSATDATDATDATANDSSGTGAPFTFPANAPETRIDWIFGSNVEFLDSRVLPSAASDHLPLYSEITLSK